MVGVLVYLNLFEMSWEDVSVVLIENNEEKNEKINIENIKKRIRYDPSSSSINPLNSSFEINDPSTTSLNLINSSSLMRLNIQINELKLLNEELNQKIILQKNENQREKEKFIRQLQFLENDNNKIKNEMELRNEKYYTLKKKYQTLLRSTDTEKQANNTSITSSSSSSFSSSNSSSFASIAQNELNQTRQQHEQISNLEKEILIKNNEIKNLKLKNIENEEKIMKLEQNYLLLRIQRDSQEQSQSQSSISGSGFVIAGGERGSSTSTNFTITTTTERKINELETIIKKQKKIIDKYEKDFKNQRILEEEIASSNTQIMQLKNNLKVMTEYEVKYNLLISEKENYYTYFQNIIKQLKESKLNENNEIISLENEGFNFDAQQLHSNNTNISPILIFKFLSNLQTKCILLLNSENNLKNKNTELQIEMNHLKDLLNEKNQLNVKLNEDIVNLNNKMNLLTKEVILYQNEVLISREVLKTFDSEFNLIINNKRSNTYSQKIENEIEKYLKIKEDMLEKLRNEFDVVRSNYQMLLQNSRDINQNVIQPESKMNVETDIQNQNLLLDEIKLLKEKCREIDEEIFALQSINPLNFYLI